MQVCLTDRWLKRHGRWRSENAKDCYRLEDSHRFISIALPSFSGVSHQLHSHVVWHAVVAMRDIFSGV